MRFDEDVFTCKIRNCIYNKYNIYKMMFNQNIKMCRYFYNDASYIFSPVVQL